MSRRSSLPALATPFATQGSGVAMCLVLAVLHWLHHHGLAGLGWLSLGVGLSLRMWLRSRRFASTLLVGACLVLATWLRWQDIRTGQQLCASGAASCALPEVPGLRTAVRVVRAGQSLTRCVAALL